MNKNYVEIDLADLCRAVFKKWKIIALCALIFAILGALYCKYESNKAKPDDATVIKSLTGRMTEEEKKNVENSAEVINAYRDIYDKQKEYNDESIYQNLNPYDIDTLILSYYVDNHYMISYPVIEETNNLIPIISAYVSGYDTDSFYDDFASKHNIADAMYVRELIKFNTDDQDSGVFRVTIYADSDQMLENIGIFVKEAISDKKSNVTELYGDHDLILTSEKTLKTVNSPLAEYQKANVERLASITDSIAKVEKLFSGEQLSYLRFLVHEERGEDISIVKNVIVGAFLGVVFSAAFYAFKYILDGTIKTKNELADTLGTNCLGTVSESPDFLALRISNIAATDNCKKIALLYSDNEEYVKQVATLVKPEAVAITGVMSDKVSYEAFSECDSMVLFGKMRKTKRKRVLELKTLCVDCKIKILGAVGI